MEGADKEKLGTFQSTEKVDLEVKNTTKEKSADPKSQKYPADPKIDFVLVYEVKEARQDAESEKERKSTREKFEENLVKIGLEVRNGPQLQKHNIDYRTRLITCPFHILCRQAELHQIRKPILHNDFFEKYHPMKKKIWCKLMKKLPDEVLHRINMMKYFYEDFKENKLESYFGADDRESFFTTAEKSRIIYDILLRTRFNDKEQKKIEFGIERLIQEEVYHACFPLHESLRQEIGDEKLEEMNDREVLRKYWTNFSNWNLTQPLDLVQKYFGSKVSFYFAWLGFYTQSLVYMAVIGTLFTFVGLFVAIFDVPSSQICDPNFGGKIYLCSLHQHVAGSRIRKFSDNCWYAKLSYVFDNPTTILLAIVTSIWATGFLEKWKRFYWRLKYRWQLLGHDEIDDLVRPQYQFKYLKNAPDINNPDDSQDYLISDLRLEKVLKMSCSYATAAFFVLLVIAALIGILVYQVIVGHLLAHFDYILSTMVISFTGALLNFIFIMCMSRLYRFTAYKLTEWECPMTQIEFDNQFAVKIFCFEFVNLYASIFYIAFFRGKFNGAPPTDPEDYDLGPDYWNGLRVFGVRTAECSQAGCMVELIIQLFVTMCGKQFFSLVMEILIPTCFRLYRTRSFQEKDDTLLPKDENSIVVENFLLNPYDEQHLFNEYLEMAVQFGFCAMFTATFPLTPVFALINNICEIRADSYKLLEVFQRPVALVSNGIGIWRTILDFISRFSVLINGLVIAFSSDLIPRMYHLLENNFSLETYWNVTLDALDTNLTEFRGRTPDNVTECYFRNDWKKIDHRWYVLMVLRLAFVLVFEHFVLAVKRILAWLIPEFPKKVSALVKYQNYRMKKDFMAKHGDVNVMHLAYQPGRENPKTVEYQ
ncbi:unnamed protein product [Bursaphelenchus xylophilus]|uniref:Anoctamin n=1 Tax=Bursaphelenchus xylophilus TaxID=6326 RepID=A0A7I8WN56_BURXY|nr:unnamed protein product [Bursaphelenchus xylophilus]CAG9092793.1 unnamed protein product [Bursaphelenchus xylophilus]